jgi:hypothetical protein
VVSFKLFIMKKISLLTLLAVVLFSAFVKIENPNPLVGRWENTRKFQGAIVSLIGNFKADGSYSGFINKKVFVTGKYQMKHDTLYIDDSTCGPGYVGIYKVQFFGLDSLRFHVLQDTCTGRREGTDNFLFKKLNK